MHPSDRREFQRLRLAKPILATMRGANALILDLGFGGAFLEHYGTATPGDSFNVAFRWQGEDVELVCEVARSNVVEERAGDGMSIVSHTGVRFTAGVGDSMSRLTDLIATSVGRILSAQKANATGVGPRSAGKTILANMGAARRNRSRGYVSYRLKGDTWWRVPTDDPEQPADGFTVAAHEDPEEIEVLCRSYLDADEEGRRLIRLVAELSVHPADE